MRHENLRMTGRIKLLLLFNGLVDAQASANLPG